MPVRIIDKNGARIISDEEAIALGIEIPLDIEKEIEDIKARLDALEKP